MAWQDRFSYVQAQEVVRSERILFCSGQPSVDADGSPVHPGDMRRQCRQALDNVETVLTAAGAHRALHALAD